MRASLLALLLMAAPALSGCGTAAYTHEMSVVLNDPSGRLGSGPVEVSLFDKDMGRSEEWARKTMARTDEGKPYETEVFGTRARTILSEDLPGQVVVALAIPAYEPNGYFVVSIAPDPTAEKTIVAPFAPYGDGSPDGGTVVPLPVHYTSKTGEHGWTIAMTVDIPPVR